MYINTILSIKKNNINANTDEIENEIDRIIYRIYELTYDEVKMIDPEIENKISEVDYNAIEV